MDYEVDKAKYAAQLFDRYERQYYDDKYMYDARMKYVEYMLENGMLEDRLSDLTKDT